MSDIVIGTSIAPGARLDIQQVAVRSWLEHGIRVISVNASAEVDSLAPAFPDVEFASAPRTAEALIGKPLVYVSDVVAAVAAAGAPVCGMVNSDIFIPTSPGLADRLAAAAADALLVGARLEVADFTDEAGAADPFGFDYFFMPAARAAGLPPAPFLLGMPMWDYWLPAAVIAAGTPVRRIDPPLGRHLPQEAAWTENIFVFGKLLIEQLGEMARREGEAAGLAPSVAEELLAEHDELHAAARAAQAAGEGDEAYARMESLARLYDRVSRTVFQYVDERAAPFDWRA